MKILVGCPTSDYKSYCLKEYAEAVKSLTYKNYDILLADNSKDNKYCKELDKYKLNYIKCDYTESARERIVNSRNKLRNYSTVTVLLKLRGLSTSCPSLSAIW